jgi:hypothetical protein
MHNPLWHKGDPPGAVPSVLSYKSSRLTFAFLPSPPHTKHRIPPVPWHKLHGTGSFFRAEYAATPTAAATEPPTMMSCKAAKARFGVQPLATSTRKHGAVLDCEWCLGEHAAAGGSRKGNGCNDDAWPPRSAALANLQELWRQRSALCAPPPSE